MAKIYRALGAEPGWTEIGHELAKWLERVGVEIQVKKWSMSINNDALYTEEHHAPTPIVEAIYAVDAATGTDYTGSFWLPEIENRRPIVDKALRIIGNPYRGDRVLLFKRMLIKAILEGTWAPELTVQFAEIRALAAEMRLIEEAEEERGGST